MFEYLMRITSIIKKLFIERYQCFHWKKVKWRRSRL